MSFCSQPSNGQARECHGPGEAAHRVDLLSAHALLSTCYNSHARDWSGDWVAARRGSGATETNMLGAAVGQLKAVLDPLRESRGSWQCRRHSTHSVQATGAQRRGMRTVRGMCRAASRAFATAVSFRHPTCTHGARRGPRDGSMAATPRTGRSAGPGGRLYFSLHTMNILNYTAVAARALASLTYSLAARRRRRVREKNRGARRGSAVALRELP